MLSDTNRIAIIEDSADVRSLLRGALEQDGYQVTAFSNAADFEQSTPALAPDLCIVDLGLPDKDGLSLVQQIAANNESAILVVSGRASLEDRVQDLELGADDYLAKPFAISEVLARVNALLRRRGPQADKGLSDVVRFSNWMVDLASFVLTDSDGETTRISAREADLLKVFLLNADQLITREQLQQALGDKSDTTSFDRAIDVRISRLRSKLRDSTRNPKIIKTIYGAGYIFIADPA